MYKRQVLRYTNFKFRDAVEGKAAAVTIKVIELFGQVGSDLLEVQMLAVVNVVDRRCEEAWDSTSTSVSPSVIGCCFRSAILDFGNSIF